MCCAGLVLLVIMSITLVSQNCWMTWQIIGSKNHLEERREFIVALQRFAAEQKFRVTFISGDVHCCGVGHLHSRGPNVDPCRDPKHMVQIISSAIVNAPPPPVVIEALHYSAETYDFDDNTVEDMYELFLEDVDKKKLRSNKLLNRRNWCSVACDDYGGLDFTLNVECEDHSGTTNYAVNVPRLERKPDYSHLISQDACIVFE
jgi:hypothetical protein